MKFQLVLLSFMVLGSFQLLDVDGSRKAGHVSVEKKCSGQPDCATMFMPNHLIFSIYHLTCAFECVPCACWLSSRN